MVKADWLMKNDNQNAQILIEYKLVYSWLVGIGGDYFRKHIDLFSQKQLKLLKKCMVDLFRFKNWVRYSNHQDCRQ